MSNQFKRVAAIDYMKSFLIIGMILGHTIQFLKLKSESSINYILDGFAGYINFISFSGFLFCFGYACYMAYLRKESKEARSKILRTALKILLAYYISAFSFRLLVTKDFSFNTFNCINLLVFNDVPHYSEFLLPFFLIAVILFLFFSSLKNNIGNFYFTLLLGVCLFSSLVIPYQKILIPQVALFIGTDQFNNFPVIPYLPYFLTGIFFAQKNMQAKRSSFIISFLISSLFLVYFIVRRSNPSRFPPSFFWITGAAFFLYCYYAMAIWLQNKKANFHFLLSIGKNILFYVLASNLILFLLAGRIKTEGVLNLVIGILIVCIIYLLNYIIYKMKSINKQQA